ncbi:MAG: DUF1415 domain-containing protein [Steroidobacteraceae bacterium]
MTTSGSPQQVIAETRAWVDRVVIGLNLCPFAKAVQARNQVRYVVSETTDTGSLLDELRAEMDRLVSDEAMLIDTILLIHPRVLGDFLDYNEFLGAADELLVQLGHEGVLQVASFHPQFQFSGTDADDVTNATNQSPYPMLHLLREASVERAVEAFPDAGVIYKKNMRTMEALGAAGVAALREQCRRDAG